MHGGTGGSPVLSVPPFLCILLLGKDGDAAMSQRRADRLRIKTAFR
jgi:hypothetical protein